MEEGKMYYVYRFINKNGAIIYVGKTNDLDNRIYTHINDGHLPLECYSQVYKIQYLIFKTKVDMDIAELYFINKFKPLYNKLDKEFNPIEIEFQNEFKWLNYEKLDFTSMYSYKYKALQLEVQCKDVTTKYARLLKVLPEQVKVPYSLSNLEANLHYVSKVIGKDIRPIRNPIGLFYFFEVIEILKENPNLRFISCNANTSILLECSKSNPIYIKATDIKNSIVDSNPIARFYIETPLESEHIFNNFILEGIVPYLHYKIKNP